MISKRTSSPLMPGFFEKFFSSLENNCKLFSLLVFLKKMGFGGKVDRWISSSLSEKNFFLNFWTIGNSVNWSVSHFSQGLNKIFKFFLKSGQVDLNLLKEYFRFSILFFKKKLRNLGFEFKQKPLTSFWWIQIICKVFASFFKEDLGKEFFCQVLQILGKATWTFLKLGKSLEPIFYLIKSRFSDQEILLKTFFFSPIPFFDNRSHITIQSLGKFKFYIKTLNPKSELPLLIICKKFYLKKKEKITSSSRHKKKKLFSIFQNFTVFSIIPPQKKKKKKSLRFDFLPFFLKNYNGIIFFAKEKLISFRTKMHRRNIFRKKSWIFWRKRTKVLLLD